MKTYAVLAVSALALSVAGCGDGPPKARTALDCPNTSGSLTRTSASAKTCTYVSSDGAEVTLQLVSVQGGPDATLSRIEDSLLAAQGLVKKDADEGKTTAEKAGAAPAAADANSAKDASAAAREAAQDAAGSLDDDSSDGVKTNVRIGARGSVTVDEDSGETHVNLPGIHIDADDSTDSANVQIGPLHVVAGEDGAVVRIRRDVRLKGESLSREKRGIRATFISQGKERMDGYRFVGYEAAGPKAGPITVAVVRAKSEVEQGDRVYRAVKRLVRDNGGV